MKIEKIIAVYFSPCGNVKKMTRYIANTLAYKLNLPITYDDFTLPANRINMRSYTEQDLVVFGVPIYAGRIPNKILNSVQTLFVGKRTFAIPVVSFGNRSFDHGLKELAMELDKNGFLAIGAAALVSEHAFSSKLATNRPSARDFDQLDVFLGKLISKVSLYHDMQSNHSMFADLCPLDRNGMFIDIDDVPGDWPLNGYYTPLGEDGNPAVFLKAKPQTDKVSCDMCGACAKVCPMGSIHPNECDLVEGVCIKCQACVNICANHAKYFDDAAFCSHVRMLEHTYQRPANNLFVI